MKVPDGHAPVCTSAAFLGAVVIGKHPLPCPLAAGSTRARVTRRCRCMRLFIRKTCVRKSMSACRTRAHTLCDTHAAHYTCRKRESSMCVLALATLAAAAPAGSTYTYRVCFITKPAASLVRYLCLRLGTRCLVKLRRCSDERLSNILGSFLIALSDNTRLLSLAAAGKCLKSLIRLSLSTNEHRVVSGCRCEMCSKRLWHAFRTSSAEQLLMPSKDVSELP